MQITYHPVSAEELQYFLFDVAESPGLASARAAELCNDEYKRAQIMRHYRSLELHCRALREEDTRRMSDTLSHLAAIFAGFLHPYWYAGASSFSLLFKECEDTQDTIKAAYPESDGSLSTLFSQYLPGKHSSCQVLQPLPSIASGFIASLEDSNQGVLSGAYAASGFVAPKKLITLIDIAEWFFLREELVTPAGLTALNRAKEYAQDYKLGLVEGSGVLDAFRQSCASDLSNLRADFLDNSTHFASTRGMYYQ